MIICIPVTHSFIGYYRIGNVVYPTLEEVLAKRKRSSGGSSSPGVKINLNSGTAGIDVANTSVQECDLHTYTLMS